MMTEQTCPRCRARELGTIGLGDGEISGCTTCGGTGTIAVPDVGPDRLPRTLHRSVVERVEWRILDVLAKARHPSSQHTARALASWLSVPAFVLGLGREECVRRLHVGVGDAADQTWAAYIAALDEHARVIELDAHRYDGDRRRSMEAAARALEQLVEALGGTEE